MADPKETAEALDRLSMFNDDMQAIYEENIAMKHNSWMTCDKGFLERMLRRERKEVDNLLEAAQTMKGIIHDDKDAVRDALRKELVDEALMCWMVSERLGV